MGTGPLNHHRERGTSSLERRFNEHRQKSETSNIEHRTLNAEFPERGLQSASTFATCECVSKFRECDVACGVVGRVTPCAPKARENLRASNFEAANLVLPLLPKGGEGRGEEANTDELGTSDANLCEAKTPHPSPHPARAGRGRKKPHRGLDQTVSPAAAGQTRLDLSGRGLHWRPAAPGLSPTAAQAPTSKRQAPKKFQEPSSNPPRANWCLILEASLELGTWNLELFTPTPLWP